MYKLFYFYTLCFAYCNGAFTILDSNAQIRTLVACESFGAILQCGSIAGDADSGYVLNIIYAIYGRTSPDICPNNGGITSTNCLAPKTNEIVRTRCNGKQVCKMSNFQGAFGNPCVETAKYLEVIYQCVPPVQTPVLDAQEIPMNGYLNQSQIGIACGYDDLIINCKDNAIIKILSASYGSYSPNMCPPMGVVNNLNCRATKTFDIIHNRCNDAKSCLIGAHHIIVGDPCPNINVNLKVEYKCISAISAKDNLIPPSPITSEVSTTPKRLPADLTDNQITSSPITTRMSTTTQPTTAVPYADDNAENLSEEDLYLPQYHVQVTANIPLTKTSYAIASDIQIPCEVDGYPTPHVQWFKDNETLLSTEHVEITGSFNHTVIIRKANQSDSGDYRCEAFNQYTRAKKVIAIAIVDILNPDCVDNPYFANCKLIAGTKYCLHQYYAKFCCKSCTQATI